MLSNLDIRQTEQARGIDGTILVLMCGENARGLIAPAAPLEKKSTIRALELLGTIFSPRNEKEGG